MLRPLFVAVLSMAGQAAAAPPAESTEPWRVASAVGLPDWIRLRLDHRLRFEHLSEQFRSSAPRGQDQALALRTLLQVGIQVESFGLLAEIQDSRVLLTDDDAPVGTVLANPLEPLRLLLAVPFGFSGGSAYWQGSLQVGRLTLDVGSRRLIARNRYRNTINGFTGVAASLSSPGLDALQAFVVVPVGRRPEASGALRSGRIALDQERWRTQLFGLLARTERPGHRVAVEGYGLGLLEADEEDAPTRNRRLFTAGLRILRRPAPGAVDLEAELTVQLGRSRRTTAPEDRRDLEHRAAFLHLGLGYTVDGWGLPRVAVLFDHATGDANPADGRENRFDTLFGARRFEFGPTGIYGLLARSNLGSLGLQVSSKPLPALRLDTMYRASWLAAPRDSFVTAQLSDPSGVGRSIGHQLEARLRWSPLPGNVDFDLGITHAWLGEVADRDPGGRRPDPQLVYAQTVLSI